MAGNGLLRRVKSVFPRQRIEQALRQRRHYIERDISENAYQRCPGCGPCRTACESHTIVLKGYAVRGSANECPTANEAQGILVYFAKSAKCNRYDKLRLFLEAMKPSGSTGLKRAEKDEHLLAQPFFPPRGSASRIRTTVESSPHCSTMV